MASSRRPMAQYERPRFKQRIGFRLPHSESASDIETLLEASLSMFVLAEIRIGLAQIA